MDALIVPTPSEELAVAVEARRASIPLAEAAFERAPRAGSGIRVAAAQFAPKLGDVSANVARIDALLAEAARHGAGLVVFPECAATGCDFADRESALGAALATDCRELEALVERCRAYQVECVVGSLLRTGDRLHNSALLLGPGGIAGRYDKAHLPSRGADRFVDPGDSGFQVIQARAARIGMLISYDLRFPEAARRLALNGAEIIALAGGWTEGAESAPGFLARARADENQVFVVACNRVGEERGARYIGRSCIISPAGAHLADASDDQEHIIIAEIEPAEARNKKIVVRPGELEMDCFADRRPDLYGAG